MSWFLALCALAYPLLVLAGLEWLDPRWLGALVATLVVVRLVASRARFPAGHRAVLIPAAGLFLLVVLFATTSNDARFLFVVPALVNAVLLATFALTLWKPPSMVEIFARMQVSELSPEEIAYCRGVTRVWCAFFVLNGGVIVFLSFAGSKAQWALYTGLVSYALMGALFAAEFVYRHYRFRRYVGAPTDALLKKFFPPREAPGGQP
jgi:uncharacterized membrane protein